MSAPRVLSIGQCSYDSAAIERLFKHDFFTEVDSVGSGTDAEGLLRNGEYALVLVNRQLDGDGSSGVALIEKLQSLSPDVPMMLVSDKPDAQADAVAKGAIPGFGKSALRHPETTQRIQEALGQVVAQDPGH